VPCAPATKADIRPSSYPTKHVKPLSTIYPMSTQSTPVYLQPTMLFARALAMVRVICTGKLTAFLVGKW